MGSLSKKRVWRPLGSQMEDTNTRRGDTEDAEATAARSLRAAAPPAPKSPTRAGRRKRARITAGWLTCCSTATRPAEGAAVAEEDGDGELEREREGVRESLPVAVPVAVAVRVRLCVAVAVAVAVGGAEPAALGDAAALPEAVEDSDSDAVEDGVSVGGALIEGEDVALALALLTAVPRGEGDGGAEGAAGAVPRGAPLPSALLECDGGAVALREARGEALGVPLRGGEREGRPDADTDGEGEAEPEAVALLCGEALPSALRDGDASIEGEGVAEGDTDGANVGGGEALSAAAGLCEGGAEAPGVAVLTQPGLRLPAALPLGAAEGCGGAVSVA
jgi:hypothetical protein